MGSVKKSIFNWNRNITITILINLYISCMHRLSCERCNDDMMMVGLCAIE